MLTKNKVKRIFDKNPQKFSALVSVSIGKLIGSHIKYLEFNKVSQKMYKLAIVVAVLGVLSHATISSSQQLTEDSALEFLVQIERIPDTPGAANEFIGVGTLLSFRHVLTSRHILQGLEAHQLLLKFRSNTLGEGYRARPENITRHGDANVNLAVLRLPQRVDQQFTFAPRERGSLNPNRFCTMFGFNRSQINRNLTVLPVFARNGTEAAQCNTTSTIFCSFGTPLQFPICDGFAGAPIFCGGSEIAGMVFNDQFCFTANPRVYIHPIQNFDEWIRNATDDARMSVQISFITILFGVLITKIFT
jgi:Trypsin